MERELDAGIHRPLSDFVQVPREDLPVFGAQVFRSDTSAEVHLQVFASEVRDVLRARRVVLDGGLNARGIEILAAAPHRAQRNAGGVEQLLEHFRGLLEILGHVVLERLEPVIAVLRRYLDARFGMRLEAAKLVPAHGIAHLVARQRKRVRGDRSPKPRADEFATSQHGNLLYFVTWVVIGWAFGNTKVAIDLVVTEPLFMPSWTLPGSTENVSPVL